LPILNYLWSVYSGLVWLTPATVAKSGAQSFLRDAALNGKIKTFAELSKQHQSEVIQNVQLKSDLDAAIAVANTAVESIKSFERESSAAKISSEASAAISIANKDSIEKQLGVLSQGLSDYIGAQDNIDQLYEKAKTTLESASKVALAASFSTRAKSLMNTQILWVFLFFIGILALIGTSAGMLPFGALPPLYVAEKIDVAALVLRLLTASPLIWFTWFCARQYGFTSRLIEDYSFKEASALAFVGYRREMSDDPEMIKMLRESAIQNFGSSPTKIFSKSDPGSPLHDLFDKAIQKDGAVEKLIDLLKHLKPGSKN
jgi:hypothetical protein